MEISYNYTRGTYQGLLWEGTVSFISALPPSQGHKQGVPHHCAQVWCTSSRGFSQTLSELWVVSYKYESRSSIPVMLQAAAAKQKFLIFISPNSDRQKMNLRVRNTASRSQVNIFLRYKAFTLSLFCFAQVTPLCPHPSLP